ncbi:MAG: sigma factor-like helix-turn-helix DNA-binding protein [Dehalococcoidia bacterium]
MTTPPTTAAPRVRNRAAEADLFRKTIEAARMGERLAFAVLFGQRGAAIAAYLGRAGDTPDLVRAMTRDVFSRAWRELPNLSPKQIDTFDAWLVKLADARLAAVHPRGLDAGIHGQPLRHRQVLALRLLMGLTSTEVARSLEASIDEVTQWEHQGLKALAAQSAQALRAA